MNTAVILMGGFGTRLKSISGPTPKPMVDINGEPFIYRVLRKLEASGVDQVVLSLHYKASEIIERISQDRPVNCKLKFVVEPFPLGTGGALKLAAQDIKADYFVGLNGDTWFDFDFDKLWKKDISTLFDVEIFCAYVKDTARFGRIEVSSAGKLISFGEKISSGPGLINGGVYRFFTKSLVAFPPQSFSLEKNYISAPEVSVGGRILNGEFIDIGVPEDYKNAVKLLS